MNLLNNWITLLDKMMGAPGLAFETWDPPRKCRKTNLEKQTL
jgi:hypothetical protein